MSFRIAATSRQARTGPAAARLADHARPVRPTVALSIGAICALWALLPLNLRPAVTSIGAVLADIVAAIHISPPISALLVAAPMACFAVGGLLAAPVRARLGTSRTIRMSLLVLALALALRVLGDATWLLAGTVVACLAIAVLAVMLPVVVRSAPAARRPPLSAWYTTSIGAGSAIGALVTPPLDDTTSWRIATGSWTVLAVAGLLAWGLVERRIGTVEHDAPLPGQANPFRLAPRWLPWSLAVHLGLVCALTFTCMGWLPQILRDSGVPPESSQWMFTLAMTLGVPFAPLVPKLAASCTNQSALALLLTTPSVLAIAGLIVAPETLAWACTALLGLGMVAVVLAIGLITMRGGRDTTAALSSLVHGIGFATASIVSLAVGLLHGATQSWHWPLAALLAVLLGQAVTGMLAGRAITVRASTRPTASV